MKLLITFKYEFQGEKYFWNTKVLELSSLISFLRVLSNYFVFME